MSSDSIEFSFGASLLSGLSGTLVALGALWVWERLRTDDDTLKIVWFVGSAFPVAESVSTVVGVLCVILIGGAYGVFVGAVIFGFEVASWLPVAGMAAAVPLWMVSGITFTYTRLLHRLVRNGEIKHPGPFALGISRIAAVELLTGHLIFGTVAGSVYTWLN